MVVDKFIMQLEVQLSDKNVSIVLSDEARDWLSKNGYDRVYGARPLGRLIQDSIKKPLAEELLFGSLIEGGTVFVELKNDKLIIKTESIQKESKRKKVEIIDT